MTDQEIRIRLMLEEAESTMARIKAIKAELISLAKASKSSMEVAALELKKTFKDEAIISSTTKFGEVTKQQWQKINESVREYNKLVSIALREARNEQMSFIKNTQQQVAAQNELDNSNKKVTSSTNGFSGALRSIVSMAGRFIGFYSLISVLRQAVNWLQQATTAAYEFSKAIFYLSVGVRALQRSGSDITFRAMYENLEKLRVTFGIFSRKELVEGAAQLVNLSRDFDFTSEQIFKLQEAIATLAVVNGRAMDDVQRTVALALSSGYTEGLQRLGVSINRVTIAQKAGQLGFEDNYMSLTEAERAYATYVLVLEKTAKYSNDLALYQESLTGKLDSSKAAITDLRVEIGDNFLPVWVMLMGWYERILMGVNGLITAFKLLGLEIAVAGAQLRLLMGGKYMSADELRRQLAPELFDKPFQLDDLEMWDDEGKRKFLDNAEGISEDFTELVTETGDELLDIQQDYQDKSEDLLKDYKQKQEDIMQQYAEKAADIERQYGEKLLDAQLDRQQKIQDAWSDYYYDLREIGIWYNNAIEDLNRKHREEEIKAEEDYQRKLLELKEEFLFDMEDAIRERDARQAFMLIRRYNLDKKQLERNRDDEQDDIDDNYERELAELKRQRAEKLRSLREELNRKFAEIQREYERELNELVIWKQREYDEREIWLARELDQAKLWYDRQMEELRRDLDRRLTVLSKAMYDQYKLQGARLKNFFDQLKAYIGNNGALTQLWKNYATWLQTLPLIPNVSIPNITGAPAPNARPITPIPSFATGGSMIANKPTIAMFGERGAELATFTPLNGGGNGSNGKVAIELFLSPDLEARVVEHSLGEMADVLVSMTRKR